MKRGAAAAGALLSGVLALVSAAWAQPGGARTYTVEPVVGASPRIDGRIGVGGEEWRAGRWETGLTFPWRAEPAPPTAFVALVDGESLHFAFQVTDEDVVLVDGAEGDESLVARGDRVELFLARDPELEDYYSIEIDPRGRVLDYRGRFYRRFDDGWDCPGLQVAARQRAGGYDVEGRIPLLSLREMGLRWTSSRPLLAGVFRGEFSHRGKTIAESWISWVRPRVETPDFHVPSAFGRFERRGEPGGDP